MARKAARMNAPQFRTLADVLEYLTHHAPLASIRRAADDAASQITNYGRFRDPRNQQDYLLLRVASRYGGRWYVGLIFDEERRHCLVTQFDPPQWEEWIGTTENPHPLWDGDNPEQFDAARDEARRIGRDIL
jgi:hypothetical protein